jgi:hypothetical protein
MSPPSASEASKSVSFDAEPPAEEAEVTWLPHEVEIDAPTILAILLCGL